MARRLSPAAGAGLASGALFYANAMVPNSHLWPFVWPLAGGMLAVYLAGRRAADGPRGTAALGLGARTGAIAGLLFFAATLTTLMLLAQPAFSLAARSIGITGTSSRGGDAMFQAAAIGALVGLVLAVVGSLAASLFVRRRPR